MSTTFKNGDVVRANASAQGLVRDAAYEVVDVRRIGPGFLATYETVLRRVDVDASPFAIVNAHLLLRPAPESSVCMRRSWCVQQVGHAGECSPSFVREAK